MKVLVVLVLSLAACNAFLFGCSKDTECNTGCCHSSTFFGRCVSRIQKGHRCSLALANQATGHCYNGCATGLSCMTGAHGDIAVEPSGYGTCASATSGGPATTPMPMTTMRPAASASANIRR